MAIEHVAIAIVSFRGAEDVALCLAALAQQTHQHFEVCICENGGQDAFARLRAAVPDALPGGQKVTLVADHSNPGYAGGVNRCITQCPDADGWWVLNPDTQPQADALAAIVARANVGDVDAVGSIVINSRQNQASAGGGWWRPWCAGVVGNFVNLDERGHAPSETPAERQLDYLMGGSLFVTRHFVDVAGLMREDYFLYAEEVEWCLRAKKLGLRLGTARDAVIGHAQGQSTGSALAHRARPKLPIYCDTRNRLLTLRDTQPAMLPVAVPMALWHISLRYLARGAWRQWLFALSGLWAGIKGERGKPAWLG